MSKYTKYKLYQKYETRGSQEAIPCYPNVFSIDGAGTMPLVIVEENSRDCGYTGDTQPIYRWYTLPIDKYYYCDACQDAQYKWVNLPISQDWECVGTTKYYKQKKMVSVDGGSTWTDVEPPQYQRGALYEQNSSSCGYRTRTTTGSPYCEQYDKYVDVYNQVSSDGGNTWQTTATTPTMVEHNSAYCGYIEPQYRTTTGSPYCIQYDKYVDVYSQYSTDGGNTWQTTATTPTMVEHNSAYCGYIEPQYRTTSGATYCSGVNKYVPVYSQVSYDGGVTWETTATTQTLVERNSPDCGYEAKFSATYSDGRTYNIDCSGTAHLYSGETHPSGYESSAMTSAKVGNCVDEIRICAFGDMYTMSSITISDSVTGIGETAFSSCSGLTSLTLPSNLRKLTHGAFIHCTKIPSVIIPSGVTEIENNVFEGCTSLSSVTLHNNITSIGGNAFNGCALREINIPDSVTNIGGWAFRNCTNLSSVTLSNNISYIKQMTFDGCTSLKSIVIPDSVIAIGSDGAGADGWAFQGCTSLSSCTIGSGVTNIAFYSFMNCSSLQSIDIPNSVTTIGSAAFQSCTSLTSCTIGSGVTSIADSAFYNCSSLVSINIPSGVTSIGSYAFGGCSSLTSIEIPNSVTSIDKWTFDKCSGLTSCTIGSGVTNIGNAAFQLCSSLTSITVNATTPPILGTNVFYKTNNCPIYVPSGSVSAYKSVWSDYASRIQAIPPTIQTKWIATYSDSHTESAECDSTSAITSAEINKTNLVSAEIGDCVTSIGNDAFRDCSSLTSCTIGSGVTSIGERSFQYCSGLTSVDIPSGVTSIAGAAFDSCTSLTSLDIPNSVTSIGEAAFMYCTGLTSIDIPNSVTSIGDFVFYGCSGLISVTVNATTPPALGFAAFNSNASGRKIYVPASSVNAYKSAEGWSDYASRIQAIP